METRSTSSDLISAKSTDHCKAQHLLALLVSLRRPARPPELASMCAFEASPELILYLCSIPNSPISLTEDFLVVPSPVAVRSFADWLRGRRVELVSTWSRKRRADSECVFELPRKRRLLLNIEDVEEKRRLIFGVHFTSPKVPFGVIECTGWSVNREQLDASEKVNYLPFDAYASGEHRERHLSCELTGIRLTGDDASTSMRRKVTKETMVAEETMTIEHNQESVLQTGVLENLEVPGGALEDRIIFGNRSACIRSLFLEDSGERNLPMMEASDVDGSATVDTGFRIGEERNMKGPKIEKSVASCSFTGETESLSQAHNTSKEPTNRLGETLNLFQAAKVFVAQKRPMKLYAKRKTYRADATSSPSLKPLSKSLEHDKAIANAKENQQSNGDHNVMELRQKKNDIDLGSKERKRSSTSLPPKDQMEEKMLPNFESYDVEEEEGSGGYGTVYRARRKIDGATVAIKCPHAKAHKHHVQNEQRMLERFGGKNFIIKYEGCIKNEDSDCFVLEHVEHDRPEVLKKEIDIVQLQWYGYCMFRALASLHKQGVIHRDVKPGNFLFSLKASKGYLIDFNLALDLHQKYGVRNDGKSKAGSDTRSGHVKLPNEKSVHTKDRKLPNTKSSERASIMSSKSKLDMKNLRRKALAQTKTRNNDLGSWNISKSQGADGSGVTSAERKKEPLPCQGRKELLSLVQEVRQSQNNDAASVLSPVRKRVVAPRNVDETFVYLTPMPLLSTGNLAAGFQTMNRGTVKSKKEGPCVGTKGFRAPEVLFRSLYQGPKVDIWSAGVTLLYLMIGRTPFFGDPEQNIKDIAKLRGSEDLWEVAKLHNRDSSFPEDLYKSKSLPSIRLLDWCETSTKRPEFLKEMPRSLIDLVDKCLTVNPRLRITAEEALRHEFFAPCHEALRKQRLQRQVLKSGLER